MCCILYVAVCAGRIVNVTSVKGRIAEPFNAAYAMTKYGGEAFSDALRIEMKQFGVTVCIVEPGNFGGATSCLNVSGNRHLFFLKFFDYSM